MKAGVIVAVVGLLGSVGGALAGSPSARVYFPAAAIVGATFCRDDKDQLRQPLEVCGSGWIRFVYPAGVNTLTTIRLHTASGIEDRDGWSLAPVEQNEVLSVTGVRLRMVELIWELVQP